MSTDERARRESEKARPSEGGDRPSEWADGHSERSDRHSERSEESLAYSAPHYDNQQLGQPEIPRSARNDILLSGGPTLADSGKFRDGQDWVIYLAEPWDQFWKRHLIRELARQSPDSRVLCVARPLSLVPGAVQHSRDWFRRLSARSQIRSLEKNLLLFQPAVLLHDHLAAHAHPFEQMNRAWLKRQMGSALRRAGLEQQGLAAVIYDPFQIEYLGLADEAISVYDCYDEYTAYPEVPGLRTKSQLAQREQAILERVDVVFAISETIRERMQKIRPDVALLPSCVDVRHFGQAAQPATPVSPELSAIPHPVVGYLGNLTSRIDYALVERLAAAHPDWSLVLVGGVTEFGFSLPPSLSARPNIHLLGPKTYDSLPCHLRGFDVCIIPYTATHPFNVNCSPLKLYEYLATGKPIVSTDLPAVRPFEGLVRIALDDEAFERLVAEAVQEQDAELSARRRRAAADNTWERRVEHFRRVVQAAHRQKSS